MAGRILLCGASKNDASAPLGLLYVSRWSSPEKASEFAEIYARSLAKRYKKVQEIGNPIGESSQPHPEYKVELLKGRHAWTTEEGAVVIEERGDNVLVSESLDAVTTETLEREVFGPEWRRTVRTRFSVPQCSVLNSYIQF